jgi:hypothetical protein
MIRAVKTESGWMKSAEASLRRAVRLPVTLLLVVFVLALVPRFLNLAVFVGPDEFSWVTRSAAFARGIVGGDLAQTYQTGHPGVTLLWVETFGAWLRYGLGLLVGSADWDAIVGSEKTMAMLGSKRQVVAVANAMLVAGSALLARRVFGVGVAWLMGFLLAFDPFLLTESRALRTEGLLTGFNTLTLLSLVLYLKEPNLRHGALAGVLTGLALLSKVSAVALLPIGVLVVVGAALFNPNLSLTARVRTGAMALLAWGGALLLTVVVLWPALWIAPTNVLQQMYDYVAFRAAEGGGGGKSFFLGRPYPKEDPGPLFYPVVLLYRTSPLLWLGLILLAVMLWFGQWPSRRERVALGAVLLYLIAYLVLITRSDLKYDRYSIPMLPALSVMAATGMVAGWRWLTVHVPRVRRLDWILALLVMISQMGLAVPHHPYYYTYWNPLLGGIRRAVHMLPVGTGGEGIEQAVAYMNALPGAESLTLASANSQKIKPMFKGQTVSMTNVDGEWFLADYTFIYISQLQRGKHDPEIIDYLARKPEVFHLNLSGLDYGWLYQGPGAAHFGGDTKLEGRATLHAYDLSAPMLSAGQSLSVTLYFRNEGQLASDRFYVRLVDDDGYVWSDSSVQPRPAFEEAFWTRKAVVEGEASLSLPPGMIPGLYHLRMGYEQAVDGASIGQFHLPAEHDTLNVTLPTRFPPPGPDETLYQVIGDELGISDYQLTPGPSWSQGSVWLTIYWRALRDVRRDYVLLVRLLTVEGGEAAYWLGRPARSALSTDEWRAGQLVQDPWLLSLPPDLRSDTYRLELAVFDADSEVEVTRFELGEVSIP